MLVQCRQCRRNTFCQTKLSLAFQREILFVCFCGGIYWGWNENNVCVNCLCLKCMCVILSVAKSLPSILTIPLGKLAAQKQNFLKHGYASLPHNNWCGFLESPLSKNVRSPPGSFWNLISLNDVKGFVSKKFASESEVPLNQIIMDKITR